MPATKSITIVGGGLAGLTLGICLRQRGVPVTVWEAGMYPRHRVCGEFISGRGQETLARLGLLDVLGKAGALPARTIAFFSSHGRSPIRELATPALSISRFALDELLAHEFKKLGGELRANERWRGADFSEGIVRATGRRMQPQEGGWRWFGLKVHARQVPLTADLEMHLSSSGYLGMSTLPGGEVNICGLFRRPFHAQEAKLDWQKMIRGDPGTTRNARLQNAVFDEASFCSIGGLSLQPQRASASTDCSIGDAITMIPPVTGNGMSMAFESAELAIEPVTNFSHEKCSWLEAQRAIAQRCDKTFARRLKWAWWLQRLLLMPSMQSGTVRIVPRVPGLWQLLLEKTR